MCRLKTHICDQTWPLGHQLVTPHLLVFVCRLEQESLSLGEWEAGSFLVEGRLQGGGLVFEEGVRYSGGHWACQRNGWGQEVEHLGVGVWMILRLPECVIPDAEGHLGLLGERAPSVGAATAMPSALQAER